ncbi:mandelate racemase [Sphingomonas sp. Leaf67]|uniref:mandelate racemase/muconate lactonizing enzyme family protein n=1 Tax=Sphingomonas sp. Leaf67 TaxID=1736230 RepID=UPI0006FA7387|nr:enolase C-terminal domain-like protein [Sphingomonas sp. Leaf67]KQN90738.1 mandelate racemase [Sphingomonas sp. Leaf67]
MRGTRIVDFRISRFQFRRDRPIGDAQVFATQANIVSLELIDEAGRAGLGFIQVLFQPLMSEAGVETAFRQEAFPLLEGREAGAVALQVTRPRGGNVRRMLLPFEEAIQHAVWDLFAQSMELPLWRLLGEKREAVPTYASGLDFHLSDNDFSDLFGRAAQAGYRGYKIKVGHPDVERDLHRLDLLKRATGDDGRPVMIDANEAWTAAETQAALDLFARAGHRIYWIEDPIPRDDIDGLRRLRLACPGTRVNSGEYLNVSGKRRLLQAEACDMLNVHGQVSDVMRAGWLAGEHNVEVTFGNSFLEIGVNMALALPGVRWLEYSFQNFEHLVEEPYVIRDGLIRGHDRPGHGLVLSAAARNEHRTPEPLTEDALPAAPRWERPA